MRVPVCPDDLARNRAFKSLSKYLQRNWCNPSSISLSTAQNVLARGLGYKDFHDLQQASKAVAADLSVPPETSVRLQISSAIEHALINETASIDQLELQRLVAELSITSLAAFNRAASFDTPREDGLMRPQVARPGLTAEHLRSVEQILKDSQNLRDQALFACMRAGSRAYEILAAKMHDGHAVLRLKLSEDISLLDGMTPQFEVRLTQYLKVAGITEGSYIFPSAKGSAEPMSTFDLRRIYICWAREANIDATLLTPHNIRRTSQRYRNDMARLVGERMGHHPANSTLAYLGEHEPPVR